MECLKSTGMMLFVAPLLCFLTLSPCLGEAFSVDASQDLSLELQRVYTLNPDDTLLTTDDPCGPQPGDIELQAGETFLYDNTTLTLQTLGVGASEVLDYGTAIAGDVTRIKFAYATTLSDPGTVIVRLYLGTTGSVCPGALFQQWTFVNLAGSDTGTNQLFTYTYDLPIAQQFVLPAGAIGVSYQFDNSDTDVVLAQGGLGNEDYLWLNCTLIENSQAYFGLYFQCSDALDIRVDPNSLAFSCPPPSAAPSSMVSGNAEAQAALSSSPPNTTAQSAAYEQVLREVQEQGQADVIVHLVEPAGPKKFNLRRRDQRRARKNEVAALQAPVMADLSNAEITLQHVFQYQPSFAGQVTSAGLQRLMNHPSVGFIEPVREMKAHTTQGIALMNAITARSTYRGQGIAIAICDTGIDYTHPDLGNDANLATNPKVIGGYDFGSGDSNPIAVGNAHGTACAGIAAGNEPVGGSVGSFVGGVAPDAKLYALKISADNSGGSNTIIIANAWEWCVDHQYDDPCHPIMVISTSFGGGRYFSACDGASPTLAQAAAAARAAGITVLASSGNDGYCDAISMPACISSVLSVGAVYDADIGVPGFCVESQSCGNITSFDPCPTDWRCVDDAAADLVTCYSNTADYLDLLAPSNNAYTSDIVGSSGYTTTDYTSSFGGTSAACPYAAGAVAGLQSAAQTILGRFLSADEIETILKDTGDLILDPRIAITKPRVDLDSAIAQLQTLVCESQIFTIYNDGAADLIVDSIDTPDWITLAPTLPYTIAAGNSLPVCVQNNCTYCASGMQITIYSNDAAQRPYPGAITLTLDVVLGDFNTDGVVAWDDVQYLASYWLDATCTGACPCDGADMDASGRVDLGDYRLLSEQFGF